MGTLVFEETAAVCVGFDIGSVAMKVAVTDDKGNLLSQSYTRTFGKPVQTALDVLSRTIGELGERPLRLVAGTGAGGRLVCELLGVPFINEVICQAWAIRRLYPQVRTLIEMGGQDSKLLMLAPAQSAQLIVDLAMNTNCAAGTGSFLDQQASRLGIKIEEEFGRLALQSRNPPRVAGRCSVFAKSDMIHLQQQAAPLHDIVAGLCLGLARNLKSNLGRGMDLQRPAAFCGGVAANTGVVHAIRTVFELEKEDLIVPSCHAVTGALGAILTRLAAHEVEPQKTAGEFNLSSLRDHLRKTADVGVRLDRLPAPRPHDAGTIPTPEELRRRRNGHPIPAYLGVDVGSISTKAAVIDENLQVLAKVYLMTAGQPLRAVRQALAEIGRQIDSNICIVGAGTTGSGRYLTGDFIGADVVINEITAQATAAAVIDPRVDTIFEIGGQDSKYISLDGGVVVDFEMNHACAAGTGSFLEEQAERLGVNIKEQFGRLALESERPLRLGERCTVFMESDLLSHQQQGAATDDLVAGLCYSIVSNYINRVVGRRRIGEHIFFQGGTAFNRGVVAAFEKVTGRPITVPPHHEVTGAIGAAALARAHQQRQGTNQSRFRGFAVAEMDADVRSFECEHCSNHCEINEVTLPDRPPLFYGSRCDRFNVKAERKSAADMPNLFHERHRMLLEHAGIKSGEKKASRRIGLPMALTNYQLLPFWGTLFGHLSFQPVLSSASTKELIHEGVEAVVSTPCFPVKVAHGHVLELIRKNVDWIWLPSVIGMGKESEDLSFSQPCPYVQAIPYQVAAALEARKQTANILRPVVDFSRGLAAVFQGLKSLRRVWGVSSQQLQQAVNAAWSAQQAFEEACRRRGREILALLAEGTAEGGCATSPPVVAQPPSAVLKRTPAVVVISRPYNGCDPGVSLDLPNKLRRLGVLPIPMDFLDLRDQRPADDSLFDRMYWKYGQRILRAATLVRNHPRLHAIYLSNFSCGPDSFLISYFKRLMTPKPSLVLEVDEHSADAGVVTRLEAFLESLHHAAAAEASAAAPIVPREHVTLAGRTIYIPWMGDWAHPLAAAFRGAGLSAQVMPVADEQTLELGRRVCSGKECLPCIITAGDMLKVTRRPDFDGARAAFFMPGGSGPCRFGQYNCLHRLILDGAGHARTPIFSLSHDHGFYDQIRALSPHLTHRAWAGLVACDLLVKALLAIRPYERLPGVTDAAYQQSLNDICRHLEQGGDDQGIAALMRRAAERFAAVDAVRRGRPRIGIVGEIYVRCHSGANNDLIRQLEALGAETALAGFCEWIYYTNWTRQQAARTDGRWGGWLGNRLQDYIQRGIERRLAAPLRPLLGHLVEPPTRKVLELAEPYIHHSFSGEAVLSVGKMLEFAHEGCAGVVNVMPFTCMPSTIVNAVSKRLAAATRGMPILSISYDGQQDPMLLTRLEAFVHQARQRAGKINSSRGDQLERC